MGRKKDEVVLDYDRMKNAEDALGKIASALSIGDWDGSVSNQIADILHAAGVTIPEPDPAALPPASCPKCDKRDQLYVHETSIVSFQYNPHNHTGNRDTEVIEHGNEDYTGYCGSCQHHGTLTSFGMLLLDWVDDSCEDDDGEE